MDENQTQSEEALRRRAAQVCEDLDSIVEEDFKRFSPACVQEGCGGHAQFDLNASGPRTCMKCGAPIPAPEEEDRAIDVVSNGQLLADLRRRRASMTPERLAAEFNDMYPPCTQPGCTGRGHPTMGPGSNCDTCGEDIPHPRYVEPKEGD